MKTKHELNKSIKARAAQIEYHMSEAKRIENILKTL